MRTSLAFIGSALALGLAACAGSSADPLEPNRMRLTAMTVADDPKTDVRYPVLLSYEATGDVRIIHSCFTWLDENGVSSWLDDWTGLGDGPYCLGPESGEIPSAVTTMLVSGYPGTYRLRAYVRYEGGGEVLTSNAVSHEVVLTRRNP